MKPGIVAAKFLAEVGLTVQINTTVCRQNVDDLQAIANLVESHGAVMWSLFFLVPTGRGRLSDVVSAERHERVFNWLYDQAGKTPYDVRTTAAPQYRRVVAQRDLAARNDDGSKCMRAFSFRHQRTVSPALLWA